MLGQPVADLSAQDACLVEFAKSLTARPWTTGAADIRELFAVGLSRESTALVIGLVAMFNYLTRVADGTGIEADYGSELPEFVYRGVTEAASRPDPSRWPAVDDSIELLSLLPDAHAAWRRWREYLLEGSAPLSVATRGELRAIAARNACDGTVSQGAAEGGLADFADKLSRTPWLVTASDADTLRAIGLDDRSILHVIAVVAYQSAESRLRIGLSALARADG
ncbi:MAG TPA: hypothetical protein VH298_12885 [Jatrophihabitans sp.]|nr:hypothetical protein [Jatrophihabitans sp.]